MVMESRPFGTYPLHRAAQLPEYLPGLFFLLRVETQGCTLHLRQTRHTIKKMPHKCNWRTQVLWTASRNIEGCANSRFAEKVQTVHVTAWGYMQIDLKINIIAASMPTSGDPAGTSLKSGTERIPRFQGLPSNLSGNSVFGWKRVRKGV